MQGVTIIEKITEPSSPIWFTIGVCILLVVCAIIITILYFDSVKKNETFLLTNSPVLKFCAWVLLVACCVAVFFHSWNHKENTVTHYIVEVDETVSLVEFTKTYDILSQDGNRYTVEEKSNDEKS